MVVQDAVAVARNPPIEGAHERGYTLARQNYGYEKHQKEMAKQKKKDAKIRRKQEKKAGSPEQAGGQSPDEVTSGPSEEPSTADQRDS